MTTPAAQPAAEHTPGAATNPEHHALVDVAELPAHDYTAVCVCGWESPPALNNIIPARAHEQHQRDAHDAADARERADAAEVVRQLVAALGGLVDKFNEYDPDKMGYAGFPVVVAEEALTYGRAWLEQEGR